MFQVHIEIVEAESKPGSYPGMVQFYIEVVESAGQLDSYPGNVQIHMEVVDYPRQPGSYPSMIQIQLPWHGPKLHGGCRSCKSFRQILLFGTGPQGVVEVVGLPGSLPGMVHVLIDAVEDAGHRGR